MLTMEKSVVIAAPAATVFAYATDPARQPDYFAGMRGVSGIERLSNGGYRFTFEARAAGLPVHGSAQHVEFDPNQRAVVKLAGTLEGTETVTFADEGGKTRVRCVAEYVLPGGLLGRLGAPVLARYLRHHIEEYYTALKARVEAQV